MKIHDSCKQMICVSMDAFAHLLFSAVAVASTFFGTLLSTLLSFFFLLYSVVYSLCTPLYFSPPYTLLSPLFPLFTRSPNLHLKTPPPSTPSLTDTPTIPSSTPDRKPPPPPTPPNSRQKTPPKTCFYKRSQSSEHASQGTSHLYPITQT